MIIGITGEIGAGKGTVVEILEKKGYKHYSARAVITEEIIRRNLPVNRPNMNEVATDLRKQFGPAFVSDYYISQAEKEGVKDFIIESIRTPAEAENIRAHGGIILAVTADKHLRYTRIQSRASETDQVTFEEFSNQEDREMKSEKPGDPAYMDMGSIIANADVNIRNEGTLEELEDQLNTALSQINK
jgi:dephospho-CoA kinase